MLALLAVFSCSVCPDLTPYFYASSFNLTIPADGWRFFYTKSPKDESSPLRMSVLSQHPVTFAAEEISICPNETTTPFLVSKGGPRPWAGNCSMVTRTGSIAIGAYSTVDQTVRVTLEQPQQMSYGKRKSLEFLGIFLAMLAAATLWFCFCILPGPKPKRD